MFHKTVYTEKNSKLSGMTLAYAFLLATVGLCNGFARLSHHPVLSVSHTLEPYQNGSS